jgi:hypothetical protein
MYPSNGTDRQRNPGVNVIKLFCFVTKKFAGKPLRLWAGNTN